MALVYRDYYFSMGCAKNGVGMGYKGILNVLNGFRVWYTSELYFEGHIWSASAFAINYCIGFGALINISDFVWYPEKCEHFQVFFYGL